MHTAEPVRQDYWLQSKGTRRMKDRPKIVAVDGPAGSGKSSICHRVASILGWSYVNTGLLYRLVGLHAQRRGLNLNAESAVADLASQLAPDIVWQHQTRQLICQGEDVTALLHSEDVGKAASVIAKQPLLRERLLPMQRDLAYTAKSGVLVDGRDIGTVVFPDADLKIFLTASLEQRSLRRLAQLEQQVEANELDSIKEGIAQRDAQDGSRAVAPMKPAADATVLDTSDLSLDESVQAMIELLKGRGLA